MSEEHYGFYFIGEEISFPYLHEKIVASLIGDSGCRVYAVFSELGFDGYDFAVELNDKKCRMIFNNYLDSDARFIKADKFFMEDEFPIEVGGLEGKLFHFECDNHSGHMTDKAFKEFVKKMTEKWK